MAQHRGGVGLDLHRGLEGREVGVAHHHLVGARAELQAVERRRHAEHDLAVTRKAASILRRGGTNAYEKALRALPQDSSDWWQSYVEDAEYPATADGLANFIREHLEPLCLGVEKEARHCTAIKTQTLGEGLQAHRLEKLNRYETHLDRKFERTLAMLLKLKSLRGA